MSMSSRRYGRFCFAIDAHLLFDDGQVVFRQISRSDDIIKKAITRIVHQRRADAELGAREKLQNRGGQQMSGRMANDLEAVARIGGDRLDRDHFVG